MTEFVKSIFRLIFIFNNGNSKKTVAIFLPRRAACHAHAARLLVFCLFTADQ